MHSQPWLAIAELSENPHPRAELAQVVGLDPGKSAEAFTELFDFDLPPFASYYLSAGPILGGDPGARIHEFIAAYFPTLIQPAQPDHLGYLSSLLARIIDEGHHNAAAALFHEHLSSWLPEYAQAAITWAPPPYRGWSELVAQLVSDAELELGYPTQLPLHLRLAPSETDTSSKEGLLDYLLSPILSGVILPRSAIVAIARAIDVPIRIGGRRFTFTSLLEGEPRQTLVEYQELAAAQNGWFEGDPRGGSTAESWWRSRRNHTISLLSSLTSSTNPLP
ncbi:MAG: molecular chaperone TorD family protein [Ferrimicrobium sp.]